MNETAPQALEGRSAIRRLRPAGGFFGVASVALGGFFAVLVLYPLGRVLLHLFVVDGHVDAGPLRKVFAIPGLGRLLLNTVLLVAVSMVFALLIGALFAWLMERTDARLSRIAVLMPMVPFLMPPIAGAIGWTFLLSERAGFINAILRNGLAHVGLNLDSGPFNIYSWWGMITLYIMYQIPFGFLMIAAGLKNSDPSLEEAARVSGSSLWQTFRGITIPVLRPSVGAAALYMVWFGFSFFSVPVIIGPQAGIDVLSVRIVRLLTFTYPAETTLAVGLSGFLVVAIGTAWYFQGRILRGGRYAAIGGKGHRAALICLGRWRRPAQALLVLYLLLALVLPLAAHAIVAMNGYWTLAVDWAHLDPTRLWSTLTQPDARLAFGTSLRLAVAGATIATLVAAVFSLHLRASTSRSSRMLDGVIKLPAALSAIVVAVGFVLAFAGPPFNLSGTLTLLLLCYLVLFLPQATVAADAAAAQVDPQLSEASRIAGAGGGRTFLRVSLPLMTPGLLAGWGLLFVWMVGELNASVMLAGTRTPVVGYFILQIFQDGGFGILASLSLTLTFVNVLVLAAVGLVSRRRGMAAYSGLPRM